MGYTICRMCCWWMVEENNTYGSLWTPTCTYWKNDNKRMWRRLSFVIIMPCLPIFTCEIIGLWKETFWKINWLCLGIELKYIDLLWLSSEGNNNTYLLYWNIKFWKIGMMSTLIVIKIHSFISNAWNECIA